MDWFLHSTFLHYLDTQGALYLMPLSLIHTFIRFLHLSALYLIFTYIYTLTNTPKSNLGFSILPRCRHVNWRLGHPEIKPPAFPLLDLLYLLSTPSDGLQQQKTVRCRSCQPRTAPNPKRGPTRYQ